MKKTKIESEFRYEGFGFPVILRSVPMVFIRGIWTPKVDYNELAKAVLVALAYKPARLTGNEIHFIRHYFEMTLKAFGRQFDVSHVAVHKWEKRGRHTATLGWSMEKDLRFFILNKLEKGSEFQRLYQTLQEKAPSSSKPIEIAKLAAA